MKKPYHIFAIALMVLVVNKSFAQPDTIKTKNDSTQTSKCTLANMSQAELDAYVDSVYWAGRTRPKLMWMSDTTKTDQQSTKMRTQDDPSSNSYVPNSDK